MATTQQIDVTEVASVIRRQGKITHPMDVTVKGKVVGRMVPPGELSEAERKKFSARDGRLCGGHGLTTRAYLSGTLRRSLTRP